MLNIINQYMFRTKSLRCISFLWSSRGQSNHFAVSRTERVELMEQTEPTLSINREGSNSDITEVTDGKEAAVIENTQKDCGKRKNDEPEESDGRRRGKRRRGAGGKKVRPGERYIPPPQKRNPTVSFNEEHFNETTYYFENGLRKVRPYYHDFKTYCKGRWIGKSLMEVFKSEFRAESIEYYQRAAEEGRIRLNDTPVKDLSIVLRNNDHMRNTVHRHEPPVVGRPLEILADNGEILVVDKPASIPVHPCGRFRHNTIIFILGKEQGISGLHTVHRLDRLTSGVLLFARNLETSKRLDQLVRDRQLVKEYVCRVEGEFPEGEIACEEPILVVSFKIGLCRVDPKGKESRTVFERLHFDGQTSVVRCLPLTGRTHQIRVHLQYLGFPILNDPIYGSYAWGPLRGKGGLVSRTNEELLHALVEEHELLDTAENAAGEVEGVKTKDEEASATNELSGTCVGNDVVSTVPTCSTIEKNGTSNENHGKDSETEATVSSEASNSEIDHLCSECKLVRADPTEKELVMYLHALRYKGPDFDYSTQLPDWAKEDWKETC